MNCIRVAGARNGLKPITLARVFAAMLAFCAVCVLNASCLSVAWADELASSEQLSAASLSAQENPKTVTAGKFEATMKKNGTLEVVGYSGNAKRIVFPAKMKGKKVTSIRFPSLTQKQAVSVVIPASVSKLSSFTSSGGLVTSFGSWFYPNLKSIDVAKGNKWFSSKDGVLFNKKGTELLSYPVARQAKSYAIPAGVKTVGKGAFRDARKLSKVTIPNSVRKLDWNCFMSSGLKEVAIPKSVTNIVGNYTFSGCPSLEKIDLQAAPKVLPLGFASRCPKLTSVVIPEGVQVLGNRKMFSGFSDEGVFACCTALKSVKLPSTLKRVGPYAFWKCSALKSLTLPNGVRQIDIGAFGDCTKLTLKVPASVSKIDPNAFDGLKKATGPGVAR